MGQRDKTACLLRLFIISKYLTLDEHLKRSNYLNLERQWNPGFIYQAK